MKIISLPFKLFALFGLLLAVLPAQAAFSVATQQGKAAGCAAGSFFDPRNGGECWSCPSNYHRTAYAVTDAKACSKLQAETFAKAQFHKKTGCDGREFLDPRNGGECWECPTDRPRRTAYAVTDDKACATKEILGEKLSAAKFKGKSNCSGSEFRDPRNGGECWSCPNEHPRRTANAVTDDKACASKAIVAETLSAASYKSKFACPAGQFLDLRNGGECWSCPAAAPLRTINPVTSNQACTDKPVEIFAANTKELCRSVINGIRAGKNGMDDLERKFKVLIQPIKKPLDAEMTKITSKIKSPKELDQLMAQLKKKVDPDVLNEVMRLQSALKSAGGKFEDLMLDSAVICDGTPQQIDQRLAALNLRPRLGHKTSALDGFFISNAHAASKQVFLAASVAGSYVDPEDHTGMNVSLSLVSNFQGSGGIYISFGPQASISVGTTIGFGVMVYPANELSDFATNGIPSVQLGVGTGKRLDDILANKVGTVAMTFPNGVDFSIDPSFQSWPGIGVSKSKNFGKEAGGLFDVNGSVTWAFPIVTWGN